MNTKPENKEGCAEVFLGCLIWIFMPAAYSLWASYVLCRVWEWLIAPNFQVFPVTQAGAAGVILILGLLRPGKTSKTKKGLWEDLVETALIWSLMPALALFTAWLVKSWI